MWLSWEWEGDIEMVWWGDGVAETGNKRMEDEAEEELEGGLGVESWGWSEEVRARLEQNDRALVAIHRWISSHLSKWKRNIITTPPSPATSLKAGTLWQ